MPKISIKAQIPSLPQERMPIYRLRTPRADEAALSQVCRPFKLKPSGKVGSYCYDATKLTYSEGPFDVTLFRASGGLRFRDRNRWQVDDGKSNLTLSDEQVARMAKRFVGRLKLAGLSELELLKVTRLHVGSSRLGGKETEERVIDVGVCFQRTVGGVRVDGPGGKIVIYLDREGKITGSDRIWREIGGVYRQVKLRSLEEAIDEVERKWARSGGGRVEVTDIRFGYFESGWTDQQDFLQPAYVFLLRLISPDERFVMKSAHVTPAAMKPTGILTPPAPRPVRQKPRRG